MKKCILIPDDVPLGFAVLTAARSTSRGVVDRLFLCGLAIIIARIAWTVKHGEVDAFEAATMIVGVGVVFLVVRWIIRSAPNRRHTDAP